MQVALRTLRFRIRPGLHLGAFTANSAVEYAMSELVKDSCLSLTRKSCVPFRLVGQRS